MTSGSDNQSDPRQIIKKASTAPGSLVRIGRKKGDNKKHLADIKAIMQVRKKRGQKNGNASNTRERSIIKDEHKH